MSDLKIIKQLEKELKVKLEKGNHIFWITRGYTLNEKEQVTSLTLLDCEVGDLRRIISPLKELKNLATLNLSNNKISDLSPLKELKNLTELDLSENKISDLSTLRELKNLTTLRLSINQINDLSPLNQLKNLTTLILSRNQISDLTPLDQLKNLKALDLATNQISDLSLLDQLKNLKTLDLSSNQISDLSPLKELKNLTTLYLFKNQISDLSPLKELKNLTQLNLGYNPIETLPHWISNFNMKIRWVEYADDGHITFFNNPLKSPPPEIVKQGKEAVKNYFEQLETQKEDYLFEAKMLILGEPGAGKTSLACKMEDPNCKLPDEDDTTKGIEIKQYFFPLVRSDFPDFKHPERLENRQFRVNLWDFGGQDIYKATHRFFLSKRSCYALVADSRYEDTDFNYWLHIVEMFGGDSPLIIVLNEKHQRKRNIDIDAMRARFSNISEVIEVDFAEDDKGRLERLKQKIRYHISQCPHVGSPVPSKWTVIREAIEKDKRNTISLQDYLDICKENSIKKNQDALVLSQYFHDIGVFLHFQDDDLLNKTIFLKPNWATHAVYKILDHELLNKQDGRFNKNDARTIWHEPEYELIRDELLKLMQKFFLTYQVDNSDEYIVPERLPAEQPKYSWDLKDNLHLYYKYDLFMPKGITSLFTVKMHRYITDHKRVWKKGVVLERDETLAEIVETYDSRNIKIRVSGKSKRDFMTIITEQLDDINAQYEKMKVDKMIPCYCDKCKNDPKPYFFEYDKLKRRLENNIPDIDCENSFKRVDIRKLIDDVIGGKSMRSKIFVSYSHKDAKWLDLFRTHIKVLENEEVIVDLWDDTKIKAGMKWREEIEKALKETKVAVLLVSTEFLASDFIIKYELPRLLKAAEEDGATIIPLILKPCRFLENKGLSQFQAINDPEKPLVKMSGVNRDSLLVSLVGRIEELIKQEERRDRYI